MKSFSATMLVVFGFALSTHAADTDRKDVVKKLASEMIDAFVKKDYGKLADGTYPSVVEEVGGREKFIEIIKDGMNKTEREGFKFLSAKVEDPGEFYTEGDNQFVVVPEIVEIEIPKGKIISKSYLLGISSDKGKTWRFIDGSGLAKKGGDKLLPKLPAKLILPEPQRPEVIPADKDKK